MTAAKIDRVRSELDGDDDRVLFADWARSAPTRRGSSRSGAGSSTSKVPATAPSEGSESRRGRNPDELVESQRHESLLNLAFPDTPAFRLLCPYDTASLDGAVIEEAVRSHPYVVEEGIKRPSPSYRGLPAIAAPFSDPLPAPPASVQELHFDLDSLDSVRRLVATRAADAQLDEERRSDLVLAVNEIATNSVRHSGRGLLRVWMGTRWLVCEVVDRGRIENPLAGRQEPTPDQQDGRGLSIANRICDLVQVRTFATGTVVRLHLQRS